MTSQIRAAENATKKVLDLMRAETGETNTGWAALRGLKKQVDEGSAADEIDQMDFADMLAVVARKRQQWKAAVEAFIVVIYVLLFFILTSVGRE